MVSRFQADRNPLYLDKPVFVAEENLNRLAEFSALSYSLEITPKPSAFVG